MSNSQKQVKAEKIPTLTDAADFPRWRRAVETQLFRNAVVPSNIDLLTSTRTLDPDWFKKNDKTNYSAAGGFDDLDYAARSFVSALGTGKGFYAWLFKVYADIFDSLSEEIKDKVSGVEDGDVVALYENIKLAIRHYEIYNPTELKKYFYGMTMEEHGKNDVMTYLAQLKRIAS